jgi:SAM-dependent MidA family methyltransferase
MRRALYAPHRGYYEHIKQIGGRGDFYTSISVGPLFGELLAFQFARWMEGQTQIVEAGAHDGQLAHDILEVLERDEPQFFAKVEYWIVEPSVARRAAQQTKLSRFHNVRWFEALSELKGRVRGVMFSNELLDAMPIHVLRWNSATHRWNEMGVALDNDRFVWTPLPSPTVELLKLPAELLNVLPDGYTIELSPAANAWWEQAAEALDAGRLMTIDYGGTLEELLNPARTRGTLRAFTQHRVSDDVLASPGEQDITAHVNFSEIIATGQRAGLKTETFTTQSQFLTAIARQTWERRRSWPAQQVRQFQTLTHPEHLGRPFRVLVQFRARTP